jgi:hypothetical protein
MNLMNARTSLSRLKGRRKEVGLVILNKVWHNLVLRRRKSGPSGHKSCHKSGAKRASETPASLEMPAGEVPEWARRDSNARPLAPEASALSN